MTARITPDERPARYMSNARKRRLWMAADRYRPARAPGPREAPRRMTPQTLNAIQRSRNG